MLPDLDVLVSGSALEGLQTHRGITHSFVGAALGALALGWIAKRLWFREKSLGEIYLVALTGFLLHIAFDLVTSYGTMIFSPFSNTRVHFDVLFIIDPYLDLLLIAGLVLGWRFLGTMGYRIGAGCLVLFLLFNTGITVAALRSLDYWAHTKGFDAEEVAALPLPFSPLHRRGLVLSEGTYYDVPFDLFSGVGEQVEKERSALSVEALHPLWRIRAGRIYKWFARFPIVEEIGSEKGTTYVIEDLRFKIRDSGLGWLGTLAMRMALDHNPRFLERRIFTLTVNLNDAGEIADVIYDGGSIDVLR
jgi:inner membrane protein